MSILAVKPALCGKDCWIRTRSLQSPIRSSCKACIRNYPNAVGVRHLHWLDQQQYRKQNPAAMFESAASIDAQAFTEKVASEVPGKADKL